MTISEVLAPYHVSEEEFTAALTQQLQESPQPDTTALTTEQEQVLSRHGGVEPGQDSDAGRHLVMSVQANLTEQIRSSIPVDEAAALLQIDPSRVRHRIRDHALCGFKLGAATRLPRWQFTADGAALPRLRSVLEALPRNLHPLEVTWFMTTPDPDLSIGGRETAPREWLEAGGDAVVVVELAGAIDTW